MDIIQKDGKRYKQVPLSPEEQDKLVCPKCNNTGSVYIREPYTPVQEGFARVVGFGISSVQCSCGRKPPVLQY